MQLKGRRSLGAAILVSVLSIGTGFVYAKEPIVEQLAPEGREDSQGDVFTIAWSSIDTGGGDLEGEGFHLAGTTGQADVGVSTGQDFVLVGGFRTASPGSHIFSDGFEKGDTSAWSRAVEQE